MSKSSKSAGRTAMAHARAWVDQRHSRPLILEAGARLARYPDKKRPGEFITHTVREDLHGLFDFEVKPTTPDAFVELIQVTTIGKRETGADHLSLVRARQAKIGAFARTTLRGERPAWLGEIYVVGWVQRKHLRIWRWTWERRDAHSVGGWVEDPPAAAPLPKLARSAPVNLLSASGRGPLPF